MIALILGTKSEIIKMSPIIRELQERKIDFFIIHSNQHYSEKNNTER
jgi:UDP-N-acetylglucosamine 2-epimerase (non-hydrolysing)